MREPTDKMKTDVEQALRWNLIRESISARSNLFVCFHECFLALIYQTNDPRIVKEYFVGRSKETVLISSSAETFDTLLKDLQTNRKGFKSVYDELSVTDIQASKHPELFPGWQTTFNTDMKIHFNLFHDVLVELRDLHHVRSESARAELVGFDIHGTKHAFKWSFGPQSVDVDRSGNPISYYSTIRTLTQRGGFGRTTKPIFRILVCSTRESFLFVLNPKTGKVHHPN